MRLLAALASASLPVAWLFAVPPLPPGSNGGLTLCGAGPRPLRAPQRLSAALGDAWWEERGAVPFSCTECGKCCQVRGDVWCSPDDAERLAEHLELDAKTLAERYGRIEVEGWIQLQERPEGGCVFLTEDGKACSVYEGRPVQCRVYPFFPRILKTPEAWNGEVVDAPDAAPSAGRLWTADTGGCEGMGEVKDVRWNKKKGLWKVGARRKPAEEEVDATRIREQLTAYEQTFVHFPHEALMLRSLANGSDPLAALSDSDAAEVRESIRALKKNMPSVTGGEAAGGSPGAGAGRFTPAPQFYDQLIALSGLVDRELLAGADSQVSVGAGEDMAPPDAEAEAAPDGVLRDRAPRTGAAGVERPPVDLEGVVRAWAIQHVVRLGLCPYAAGVVEGMRTVVRGDISSEAAARALFLNEAKFLMDHTEEQVPTTIVALPNLYPEDFMRWHLFTEQLADDLEVGGTLEHIGDDVLVAVFHPAFEFGGLDDEDEVLNYEKRAPMPLINLLRTAAIDRGIAKGITAESIREHNEAALRAEGLAAVQHEYMRAALGHDADTANTGDAAGSSGGSDVRPGGLS